jgi:hypothetical protein
MFSKHLHQELNDKTTDVVDPVVETKGYVVFKYPTAKGELYTFIDNNIAQMRTSKRH